MAEISKNNLKESPSCSFQFVCFENGNTREMNYILYWQEILTSFPFPRVFQHERNVKTPGFLPSHVCSSPSRNKQ